MIRVMIITGLRIQALHITNNSDFTYSKGYIGLLSVLGGLLGVMTCCVPSLWTLASSSSVQTSLKWVLSTTTLKTRFPDAFAFRRSAIAFQRSAVGSIVSVEGTLIPARSELKESMISDV